MVLLWICCLVCHSFFQEQVSFNFVQSPIVKGFWAQEMKSVTASIFYYISMDQMLWVFGAFLKVILACFSISSFTLIKRLYFHFMPLEWYWYRRGWYWQSVQLEGSVSLVTPHSASYVFFLLWTFLLPPLIACWSGLRVVMVAQSQDTTSDVQQCR